MSHSHSHGACNGDHHHAAHPSEDCSGHNHAHSVPSVTTHSITLRDVVGAFQPQRLIELYRSDYFFHHYLLFFFGRLLLLIFGLCKSFFGGDLHYTLLPTIYGVFSTIPVGVLCFSVLAKVFPIHSAYNEYKAKRQPLVSVFVASTIVSFIGLYYVFEHQPELLTHSHVTEYSFQLDIGLLNPFYLCWVVFIAASWQMFCQEPSTSTPFMHNVYTIWCSIIYIDIIHVFQYLKPVFLIRQPDVYNHLIVIVLAVTCIYLNHDIIKSYLVILAHGVPPTMLQALNNLTPHEKPQVWSADGHAPIITATLTFPQVNADGQILPNLPVDSKLLIN